MGSFNSNPELDDQKDQHNPLEDPNAVLSIAQSSIDPFLFSSMPRNNQSSARSREDCSSMNSMIEPTQPDILKLLKTDMQYKNYLPDDNLDPECLGPFKYEDQSTYQGQLKGKLRHGFGTLVWADGSYYTGTWHEDRKEGFGRYISDSRDFYQGEWKNGKQHGRGIYRKKKISREGIW